MKKFLFAAFLLSACTLLTAQPVSKIRVGFYENPPKIYTDTSGNPSGFWAKLISDIAEKENWTIVWVHGTWKENIERLEQHAIDILVDMGDTPERRKRFVISDKTVLLSWSELYTRKNFTIQSLMDLVHQKIGGLEGSVNLDGPGGLREMLDSLKIEAKIVEFDSYDEVFAAVRAGTVFAGITNKDYGFQFAGRYTLKRAPILFQPIRYQFAFPENSPLSDYLKKTIDARMKVLKNNPRSIYYTLMDHFFGHQKQIKIVPLWLLITAAVFIFLAVVFVLFIFLLRSQIQSRTSQLHAKMEEQLITAAALQKSLNHYESLFENVPVALWEEDFNPLIKHLNDLKNDGIQDFQIYFKEHPKALRRCLKKIRILNINKTSLMLHRAESKAALITNFQNTLTHESFTVFKDEIVALAGGQTEFNSEAIIKDFNGEGKTIYLSLKVPMNNNRPDYGHTVVAMTDISTQKQLTHELEAYRRHLEEMVDNRTRQLETKTKNLEKTQQAMTYLLEDVNEARHQLEQSNTRLIETNEELESFSYSVSHDLRSPLRAIKGYTEMLLENKIIQQDDKSKNLAKVVYENSEKMGELIKDLLYFSHMGRSTLEFSLIDMKEMAESVFKELVPESEQKRITFSVGELIKASGDNHLLHEVWFNLIANAVKFSSKRKNAVITVSCQKKDTLLMYTIKDNGNGFNMKYKDKLFKVFKRLHSDREFEGTGIGLALVQRIIQRHGGTVWGEGETGKGAVFYFTLPENPDYNPRLKESGHS